MLNFAHAVAQAKLSIALCAYRKTMLLQPQDVSGCLAVWPFVWPSLRQPVMNDSILYNKKPISQAVARIADRTAKNCRGHVT